MGHSERLAGLKQYFGYDSFRPFQERIICSILEEKDVLAVLPTGAGKSLCYQLPALLSEGVCVVISPLIALMQDQVRQLHQLGVKAAYLNSAMTLEEKRETYSNLTHYKLLYVSPERFVDPEWQSTLLSLDVRFIVIDEAHCISQWGHSFRPDYRNLTHLKQQFPDVIIAAFTATATKDVSVDICNQLSLKDPDVITGSFDRENLMIRFHERIRLKDQIMQALSVHKEGSGIIYVPTRKKVDELASWLNDEGFSVAAYHAGLSTNVRQQAQDDFIFDRVRIMVATLAFGMGINKPDIRFVVHTGMPQNMEQYYQEIGRAGRDGEPAECLCLYSTQDIILQKQFAHQESDDAVRHHLLQKINQMAAFCQSARCRRIDLLYYFGQTYDDTCSLCDNCVDEIEWMDGTEIAQKILSCVFRLHQQFGVQHVIHVLRGSKNKVILERRHDQLSTHGLLANFKVADVRYFVYSLINQGYLFITEGQYPILKLTERSKEILYQNKTIQFKQRYEAKESVSKKNTEALSYDNDVYKALKDLRTSLAQSRGVPAYIIFHDRTLKHIADALPATKEQLLAVNGIGPEKCKSYGDAILDVLSSFHSQQAVQTG